MELNLIYFFIELLLIQAIALFLIIINIMIHYCFLLSQELLPGLNKDIVNVINEL